MLIFHKVTDIQNHLSNLKNQKHTIGFVPTMGALHQGHISIVKQSKSENHCTVASIFINPTQFNNADDLAKYPKTIGKDIEQLEHAECDVLFLPDTHEIYPDGTTYNLVFEIGHLDTIMEGVFRPGHFKGVAQVVKRLIDIVAPDFLYLGQKDIQQFMVVKKMIADLKMATKLKMAATLRETNGLAMSSRNMRLSETERNEAASIYRILKLAEQAIHNKEKFDFIKKQSETFLKAIPNSKLEYFEIADVTTLQLVNYNKSNNSLVICVALWLGNVRLIDNIIVAQ